MLSVFRLGFAHWLPCLKPVYFSSRFTPCPPLPRYLRVNYILGQEGELKHPHNQKKSPTKQPRPKQPDQRTEIFKMHVTLSKHFWSLFCITVPLSWMAVASLRGPCGYCSPWSTQVECVCSKEVLPSPASRTAPGQHAAGLFHEWI